MCAYQDRMMPVKVSKRQRQIIEMLLRRQDEITVAQIAQEIKVSSRTVHRELLEIESILETAGVTLLKKAGLGIQIQAARAQLDQLTVDLLQTEPQEYTQEERKVLILCKLLKKDEPIKLFSLSHDLQAAIPTISSDLDEMESWVERNGLTLIRRRGYGVEITGHEINKRRCISLLAQYHLDDAVLFGGAADLPTDRVTRELLKMIGTGHFLQIENALWKLEEGYPTSLTEGAYTQLLIQLSIALTRIGQGLVIGAGEQEDEGNREAAENRRYEAFVGSLQMHLQLPPREQLYISSLLKNWEKHKDQARLVHGDLQHMGFVTGLIRYVAVELGIGLAEDRSLTEGLMQHVIPAMQRLVNGEAIRNPLLSQIKKDYELLFRVVREGVANTAPDLAVPDEEIGYLVMHFGAALERVRQFSRKIRALLVCTSGIGSSKLLAVRIEKELPQIELLGHVSWFEAARVPKDDYDLVISTVDLPIPADQYIRLSPLLTRDEVEKLRTFIQNITLKRVPEPGDEPKRMDSPLKLLQSVTLYSREIVKLIEQFQVHHLTLPRQEEPSGIREIIAEICSIIGSSRRIDDVQGIVEHLILREEYGSQVIPHSHLALLHTRSEAVHAPVLALFRFDRPLRWKDLQEKQVQRALLMLGPKQMERETLEVLSEVSAMLLEPGVIRRLELDDEESIKRFFSHRFEQFLKTKLDWRDET